MRREDTDHDMAAEPTVGQVLHPAAGLETSVEIRDKWAIYEVRTGDPLYQERLEHMGFAPVHVEPVTAMTGWIADSGGRAHVRWRGHDVPVAPLELQLAVNQRCGLISRIQKIHAYCSTRTDQHQLSTQ